MFIQLKEQTNLSTMPEIKVRETKLLITDENLVIIFSVQILLLYRPFPDPFIHSSYF